MEIIRSKYNSMPEQVQENKENIEIIAKEIVKIGNSVYRIVGTVANVSQLPANLTSDDVGVAYNVGASAPYHIYSWGYVNGVLAWTDNGTIKGEAGQGFDYKGAWASGSDYVEYDVVVYDGSAYVCILDVTGSVVAPDIDTTHFDLFSSKGDQGDAGTPGTPGTPGTNGISIYAVSTTATTSTTNINLTDIVIPTGRTLQAGDNLITQNGLIFEAISESSGIVTVSYISNINTNVNLLTMLPGATSITVSISTSGDTYTAPNNGYFRVKQAGTSTAGAVIAARNTKYGNVLESRVYMSGSSQYPSVFVPAKKGDILQVQFSPATLTLACEFYPAEEI